MVEPWWQKLRRWVRLLPRNGPCRILGHRWQTNSADARYEWCPRCRDGRLTPTRNGSCATKDSTHE